MRSQLLLLSLMSIPVTATTYYGIDSNLAFFNLLGTQNLSIGFDGASAVTGDVGSINLAFGASSTVSATAYLSGGQTCSSNCGSVLGGYVFNSTQYAASVSAWNNLAGTLNALPATSVSIFSSTTLTSGVWQATSTVFLSSQTLTLDAQGDPNAQFVVRAGSVYMDGNATINFINGARPENFLVLSSNVSMQTSSPLSGIFRSTGPLVRYGSSMSDRLTLVGYNLVYSGQLTEPAAIVPESSAFAMTALGCATLIGIRRFRRA